MTAIKKSPGRPKKPEDQKHKSAHALRMTPTEKTEFAEFAARDSRSLSSFLILACHYFVNKYPTGTGAIIVPKRSRAGGEYCDKGHPLMMTTEEHETFKDAAATLNMKLSQFIRTAARTYIADHAPKRGKG